MSDTNTRPPRPYTFEELKDVNPEVWTPQDQLTIQQFAWDHIQPWFAFAGIDPETYQFPACEEDVVKVLRAIGYEISRDVILNYIAKGRIFQPKLSGGRRVYQATDIAQLCAKLEQCRAWRDFSRQHDNKKTQLELHMQEARAAGCEYKFEDLERFSARDILRFVVEANNPTTRISLAEVLKAKLAEVDWT